MDSHFAPSLFSQGVSVQLDHLGIIEVSGPDAARFLQGQLTNDVLTQDLNNARLTGYCSPRGRLLATALIWRSANETFQLLLARDVLRVILKRLSMYVLRSKVTLTEASSDTTLWGLAGALAGACIAGRVNPLPESPFAVTQQDEVRVISVPSAMGFSRWLVVAGKDSLQPWTQAACGLINPGAQFWRWLDIRAGIPTVTCAIQEKFVPQMINFEALGGVDFDKGCYPGQEVVARSQYLGRMKRRTLLAHLDASNLVPGAGSDVFDAGSPEPCGMVVAAESSPLGGVDLLVELPVDAHPAGFHVAGPDGPLLSILELPYSIPDPEVFVRPKL